MSNRSVRCDYQIEICHHRRGVDEGVGAAIEVFEAFNPCVFRKTVQLFEPMLPLKTNQADARNAAEGNELRKGNGPSDVVEPLAALPSNANFESVRSDPLPPFGNQLAFCFEVG